MDDELWWKWTKLVFRGFSGRRFAHETNKDCLQKEVERQIVRNILQE